MSDSNTSFHSRRDRFFSWLLYSLTALTGLIVVFIIGFLFSESAPAFRQIGLSRFFTDQSWHPTENSYLLTPMLLGTLFVSVGSLLIATPLGILSAIFNHFYAPPQIARLYRMLIQVLAGIPSVVYGFWGLVVLVPLVGKLHPPGPSLLAGIFILTIMILPTIALMTDAALENVPETYIHAAAALGLSRWGMLRGAVLPAARSGLITAVILAAGRAAGETMALLMVCGNVVQNPTSLFAPIRTLTTNIALEMAYAMNLHRSTLFVSGLMLMGMIVLLVLTTHIVKRNEQRA